MIFTARSHRPISGLNGEGTEKIEVPRARHAAMAQPPPGKGNESRSARGSHRVIKIDFVPAPVNYMLFMAFMSWTSRSVVLVPGTGMALLVELEAFDGVAGDASAFA